MIASYCQGFGVGAGLIVAIGAQNAFVLSQGIRRNAPLVIALICTLCDAVLMAVGIAGVGTVVASSAILTSIATWGGALFLFWYGVKAFYSAFQGGVLDTEVNSMTSLRMTVAATLAVTLLNPHVYLDTVVLLGSISGQFVGPERLFFGAGAMSASALWFFFLSFGGRLLAPFFQRPVAWRCLDALVGTTMWAIALSLLWPSGL